MSNNSRERKVRGSQIRSSRENKRSNSRDKKEIRRLERQQQGDDDSQYQSRVLPESDSFVETPAVKRIKRRASRWIDVSRPVHLIGPTGCGKTALAMNIAGMRDRPTVWINGDADLSTSDLIGEFGEKERISEKDKYVHNVQKSKEIIRDRWVDNPLSIAVREGATLVYNEFSRTKPVANNVLLSVFEEGILELPGQRGESRYIEVHPEFRAILTSNSTEYAGAHKPQDALLDRLIGIHMNFYDEETEQKIVSQHVDSLDADTVTEMVRFFRQLRGTVEHSIGTRAMLMTAEALSTMESYDETDVIELSTDVLASKIAHQDELDHLREQIAEAIHKSDTEWR